MILAFIAAVVATIGDFILLAAANSGNPAFSSVPVPSDSVLLIGTYLGLLAIPCYAFGYEAAASLLDDRHATVFLRAGVIGAVLGGTTHALTGLALHLGRRSSVTGTDFAAVLAPAAAYLVPIWIILALTSMVAGYLFAVGVLHERSSLPRWLAPASPIVLTLVIALLAIPSTFGREIIVPAAPNLSHILFFGLLAVLPEARLSVARRAL